MRSAAFLVSLAALAGSTLASLPNGVVMGIAIAPATPTPEAAAQLRAQTVDWACVSSVESALLPATPSATDFAKWESTATQDDAPCTLTAPASFASAVISYWDVLETWAKTVSSAAGNIHTLCGANTFSLSVTQQCTRSVTAVFTDATNQTSTTVLPPINAPTSAIYLSGAPAGKNGVIGAAMGLAAVLAVVLAL